MCEICHQHTCPSPCPNAETAALGVCAYCEEVIYDSEPRVREQDGRLFHAESLESLPLGELLGVFGVEVEVEE